MRAILRALAPPAALLGGALLLRRAFVAHGERQALLATGDPSAAELPQIDLWLSLPPALALILSGAFLAGRWWRR